MRHYEIVLLVHPDQSGQVSGMIERYKKTITENGGSVHRQEDWGRRQMAYSINKVRKAHYILFNIECGEQTRQDLEHNFRYNDAILRYLILNVDDAVTKESAMSQAVKRKEMRKQSRWL